MSEPYSVYTRRCILSLDGKYYEPVTVIRSSSCYSKAGDKETVVNQSIINRLRNNESLTNNKIAKGASLYLANNIKIDINVIRKHYNVKRRPEDADYVVVSPIETYSDLYMSELRFFSEKNILIDYSYFDTDDLIRTKCELGITENGIGINDKFLYSFQDPKDFTSKFLNGTFGKPVIYHTQLDLDSGDPVTFDVLELTKRLGSAAYYSPDADKNFKLNIQALNNYNWRKYKGTLGILFRSLSRMPDVIYNLILNRIRSQNKTIQDVLLCRKCFDFQCEEDFLLAQDYVSKILNIDHYPMFVSTAQIISKLSDNYIGLVEFEKLFCAVAKIQKEEYVEKKSED